MFVDVREIEAEINNAKLLKATNKSIDLVRSKISKEKSCKEDQECLKRLEDYKAKIS